MPVPHQEENYKLKELNAAAKKIMNCDTGIKYG
jgi:hypothetical protein